MKRLTLAILLLSSLAAAAQTPDAEVLRLVNASRPSDQKPLEAKQVRILRPSELPGVTLVGYLTGSRGALLGTVVLDGKAMLPAEAAGLEMARLGWQQADPKARVALARLWVEKAVLAFGESVLEARPSGFKTRFDPPRQQATAAGGVRLELWIEEDQGANTSHNYRKSLFLFSPEGKLQRAKTLERYEALSE